MANHKSKNIKYIVLAGILVINTVLLGLYFFGPFKQGTVEDAGFTLDTEDLKYIEGGNLDFGDITNFFVNLAEEKDAEYAMNLLIYATGNNILPSGIDTHLLGHSVADVLYKQRGLEGIDVCTHDLRNACSHSIVIGTLLERGVGALEDIAEICRNAPGGKGAYTMCFHGLGHGVLAFAEYELEDAIVLCEKTGTTEYGNREYVECVGGAVMEMMAGIHDRELWLEKKDKYLSADDPLSPCNKDIIPKEAKGMCYTYLTPHLIEIVGGDLGNPSSESIEKAMAFCELLPTSTHKEDRNTCFSSFGKEFIAMVNGRNVQNIGDMSDDKLQKIYDLCQLVNDKEGVRYCLSSALTSLYWGGENRPGASIRFCSLMPKQDEKDFCFTNMFGMVRYYVDDITYRKDICLGVPETFNIQCQDVLL
ncbi:MAG: hypothetical protein WDZ40_01475 [Candidatus Spechtbacterales bacterium]